MNRLETLEEQVKNLSPEELNEFRNWFTEFDAELWDRQFERDVNAGKLDELAGRALADHKAGRSTKL